VAGRHRDGRHPPGLHPGRSRPADRSGLAFVLDHLSKPPIAAGELHPWAALVRELAALPNVSCKLSGMATEAGPRWTPSVRPG
jgi:L-fuconolactonase